MSELCRFRGMTIQMYAGDHAPPHFHVRAGAFRAQVGLQTMQVSEGYLPPRAAAAIYSSGLSRAEQNWNRRGLAYSVASNPTGSHRRSEGGAAARDGAPRRPIPQSACVDSPPA